MRADRRGSMSISVQWRCTLKLAFLPTHALCVQYQEVIDVFLWNEVLLAGVTKPIKNDANLLFLFLIVCNIILNVLILIVYPLAPELSDHPPKKMISGPEIFDVCPYLGSGGVPLTRSLAHMKLSVSRILKSLR